MRDDLIKALEDTLARPTCEFLRIDRGAAAELLAILKPPAREDAQPAGDKSVGQIAYEGWAQGLPGCEWANQTTTQKRAWEKAGQAVRTHLAPGRVRVAVEALTVARSQAERGADKAGCDGWRSQEMCRQIVPLIDQALAALQAFFGDKAK